MLIKIKDLERGQTVFESEGWREIELTVLITPRYREDSVGTGWFTIVADMEGAEFELFSNYKYSQYSPRIYSERQHVNPSNVVVRKNYINKPIIGEASL